MSSNYYVLVPPPTSAPYLCNEVHIGKTSGGWEFHFRGYNMTSVMFDKNTPNCEILSFSAWQKFLIENSKHSYFKGCLRTVYDEYGDFYTVTEFLNIVRNSKNGTFIREKAIYVPPVNFYSWYIDTPNCYPRSEFFLDDQGWSFDLTEFS